MPNLLTTLGSIAGKAAGGVVQDKFSGRIPDKWVYLSDPSTGQPTPAPGGGEFVPDQSYFQVTVNQMYLEQERRLWVQQEHIGAIWLGFDYNGATQSVPFMIGRQQLQGVTNNLPDNARVELRNVRVGRAYPYLGGPLELYVGLWSTPTMDWATAAFSALDAIAGRVGLASSLGPVLSIVEGLNKGIGIVLGLDKVRPLLNLYQEFQQPDAGGADALIPGYYVLINAPKTFDPQYLRVLDSKLCYVSGNDGRFYPFQATKRSFILYSITSRAQQDGAVAMFSKGYQEVARQLINSKVYPSRLDEAVQAYHALQTGIVSSPDLTNIEKNQLLLYFRAKMADDLKLFGISTTAGSLGSNAATASAAPTPTQADYEARAAQMDPSAMGADPAATAGAAANWFDTQVHQVSG